MTPWKTLAMNFTTAYDLNTLEGLPGVNVEIHIDKDDALRQSTHREGLTVEALQTDVEYQMKLARIRVLTEDERLLTPSCPVLLVTVGIVEPKGDITGVPAHLRSRSGCTRWLLFTGGLRVSVEFWNMGYVGFAASSNVRTLVREQVKDKTIAFVNAWLTVNPTRPSAWE